MTTDQFVFDRAGFPMIWVEAIDAHMHWMPVTKIQFEYFLCDEPDSHFNAKWYDDVLYLNPRITPNAIRRNNYWEAFLTGIMPSEAQRFARWCGNQYAIPTLGEWYEAYQALKARPANPEIISAMMDLHGRRRSVLEQLASASDMAFREMRYTNRTLADQMLMRMGVMEWVECRNRHFQWGGMGETHPDFYGGLFTPEHGDPHTPNNPEADRLRAYGFRLVRRSV